MTQLVPLKSQTVRVIDVLLYGPFCLYLATQQKVAWHKIGLNIIGVSTIVYNAQNYIKHSGRGI